MSTCGVNEDDALRIREIAKSIKSTSNKAESSTGGDSDYRSFISNKKVWYDEESDTYTAYLPGVAHAVEIPGQIHRDIIRAYSNYDGNPATINEIARSFKLPRNWIIKYLKVNQITHDVEPFSKEEIMSRSDDDLVEEALQIRRAALYTKLEREKWKDIKKDAEKWRNLEDSVLRHISDALSNRPDPVLYEDSDLESGDEFAVVVGLSDLHFGKYGSYHESGELYNKNVSAERLFSSTRDALGRLLHFGTPDLFVVPIGSDFFHADTQANTTTSGTPQDTDGNIADMFVEGCFLMESWIDMLSGISKVKLVLMPGNHDRLLGLSLLMYLDALYRDSDIVDVVRDRRSRTYLDYGQNLIGFSHGDGVGKTKDLAALMSTEASHHWATCAHKVIYTGHLHSEKVEVDSYYGVTRRQLPCLSGTDRWHELKGYVGHKKSLPMYIHDIDDGLIAVVYGRCDAY